MTQQTTDLQTARERAAREDQFIGTPEFAAICREFGILPGEDAAADLTPKRRDEFFARCDEAMNRV